MKHFDLLLNIQVDSDLNNKSYTQMAIIQELRNWHKQEQLENKLILILINLHSHFKSY